MSRVRCYFTIALCVKEKFGNSYKDIPDKKFQEVVDYINFLKEPKLSKRTFCSYSVLWSVSSLKLLCINAKSILVTK